MNTSECLQYFVDIYSCHRTPDFLTKPFSTPTVECLQTYDRCKKYRHRWPSVVINRSRRRPPFPTVRHHCEKPLPSRPAESQPAGAFPLPAGDPNRPPSCTCPPAVAVRVALNQGLQCLGHASVHRSRRRRRFLHPSIAYPFFSSSWMKFAHSVECTLEHPAKVTCITGEGGVERGIDGLRATMVYCCMGVIGLGLN